MFQCLMVLVLYNTKFHLNLKGLLLLLALLETDQASASCKCASPLLHVDVKVFIGRKKPYSLIIENRLEMCATHLD